MKKIVSIGPESTGKSTLCADLAAHFHAEWVPEYAREYLTTNGMNYHYDDLLIIAQRQLALEDDCAKRSVGDYLFIDTDMYVMKVWCEFVFGKCHQWILDQIAARRYDLYLLCGPDIPWTADPLREYPDLASRMQLFHYYKDLLINQHTPWVELHGDRSARLSQAAGPVSGLLQ